MTRILSRAARRLLGKIDGVRKPRALCAYLAKRSLAWRGVPLQKIPLFTERVAASYFAKKLGEKSKVASFFAKEAVRVLMGKKTCISHMTDEQKEAVEEPTLHQITDFSKRIPGDSEIELQDKVQYGNNGLDQEEGCGCPCGHHQHGKPVMEPRHDDLLIEMPEKSQSRQVLNPMVLLDLAASKDLLG